MLRKAVQQAGKDAGAVLQPGGKGDDLIVQRLIVDKNAVLVFIQRAAGDTGRLGRLRQAADLSHRQHPLGFHHPQEHLRQDGAVHQQQLGAFLTGRPLQIDHFNTSCIQLFAYYGHSTMRLPALQG